jgi:predicted phosphodiesterase
MRLGIISDIHCAPADAEPYVWHNTVDLSRSLELLDAGLDWLREQQIDMLVLLGDLTEAADPASFAAVRERALAFGVPVMAVPGNCDVDPVDRTVTAFEQIAESGLTVAPAFLPLDEGPAIELIGLAGETGSKRLVGVRATDAAPTGMQIVLTHYPMLDFEADLAEAGFKHSGNLTNRAEIETELRESGTPTVVIHGHLHMHEARVSGSLLHLSCAALIEPPHHVSVIEVAVGNDEIVVERRGHSVQPFAVERLPVFAPDRGRWIWADSAWSARPRS